MESYTPPERLPSSTMAGPAISAFSHRHCTVALVPVDVRVQMTPLPFWPCGAACNYRVPANSTPSTFWKYFPSQRVSFIVVIPIKTCFRSLRSEDVFHLSEWADRSINAASWKVPNISDPVNVYINRLAISLFFPIDQYKPPVGGRTTLSSKESAGPHPLSWPIR